MGTYNEYYFEKEDVEATLDKMGLLTRLLRVVYKKEGLDTIKSLVERNNNRKYNWLDDDMMTDIINTLENKEYER
tara:strand:+ start:169 stop:393 length:225 start_codon:yes stop_codon:yes gene_type:complete